MCVPVSTCCFCLSVELGVRLIAGLLIVVEVALCTHNAILISQSHEALMEVLDEIGVHDFDVNFAARISAVVAGYAILVLCDILLLVATFNRARCLMLPWLVVYMGMIICSLLAVPLVAVWFLFVEPTPVFALLCIVPLVLALALIYMWVVVNGFFVTIATTNGANQAQPMNNPDTNNNENVTVSV